MRQLRNVLRTMLALRTGERLTLAEFDEDWLAGGRERGGAARGGRARTLDGDGESVLSGAERDALRRTLEACQWNVSAAAARLHISRRTIYRKIHRHGLRAAWFQRAPWGSRAGVRLDFPSCITHKRRGKTIMAINNSPVGR